MRDRGRSEELRIPIVEEDVRIDAREKVTGRVHVRTFVDDEEVKLSELLGRDEVDVERVPIGREIEVAPAPFERDGNLIVPIVEERLVVTKQLFLVEEVRIRRRHTSQPVEVPVTRRTMRVEVDRDDFTTEQGHENGN